MSKKVSKLPPQAEPTELQLNQFKHQCIKMSRNYLRRQSLRNLELKNNFITNNYVSKLPPQAEPTEPPSIEELRKMATYVSKLPPQAEPTELNGYNEC